MTEGKGGESGSLLQPPRQTGTNVIITCSRFPPHHKQMAAPPVRRRSTAAYVFKMWQRPFLWLQEGRNREGGEGEHNWAGFNHEASARTVGVPPVCQRQCAPTRERSLSKLQGVLNSFTRHCYTATLDYRGVGVGGGNIQRSTRAKVNSPIFNLATQIAPEECAVSDPI